MDSCKNITIRVPCIPGFLCKAIFRGCAEIEIFEDLFTSAIISAETCQMVLNSILANICIEKIWGDEKILVTPVTWQISAQPLLLWCFLFFLIWFPPTCCSLMCVSSFCLCLISSIKQQESMKCYWSYLELLFRNSLTKPPIDFNCVGNVILKYWQISIFWWKPNMFQEGPTIQIKPYLSNFRGSH